MGSLSKGSVLPPQAPLSLGEDTMPLQTLHCYLCVKMLDLYGTGVD